MKHSLLKPRTFKKTSKQICSFLAVFVLCLFCWISTNAQGKDSRGTDFWLTFPGNLDLSAQPRLFISGEANTSGVVSIPGLGLSYPFTVTVGNVTTIDLPVGVFIDVSDFIDNNGIHVTAGKEVTIYGLNREQYTTDAYLGLPTDILGTEYINLGYKNSNIVNGTQFGIVATANGTIVTINPAATTDGHTGGVPYNITLNQGQTYLLRNMGAAPNDLTGTIITSTKPIAVFGGHKCANIPPGAYACDHIVEELPPISAWGKNFVTVPLKTRLNGDTFRFLASQNNTQVKVNGTVVANLNRGQSFETILATSSQIISTQPILVAQYSNGTTYDNVTSDPFMMLIPPYEQFLGSYTITTPATGFSANFINVVAPAAAIGSIKLDGTTINPAAFSAIGSSGFYGAQLDISLGVHTLNGSNLPFGVFVYGFDSFDSYGYPGGQSLSEVARVSAVTISPKTGTGQIATQSCHTALVKDQFGNVLESVRVDFKILGANPGASGFANTDAAGKAQYCYTGSNPGNDTIVSSVGTITDTAYFTWAPKTCNVLITYKQTNVTCYGSKTGNIDLTVSGGTSPYTYAWSNGAITQDINNIAAGTYSIKVTDKSGCTATAAITITQPMAITAKATATNATCKGNDGAITITASGGVAPYTYLLNGTSNTTGIFTALTAGSYDYVITDKNGCTYKGVSTITKPAPLAVTIKAGNVTCKGGDGSITITASGGNPPYTYALNGTINSTGIFTGLNAGDYNYTVTDKSSCSITGKVSITQVDPIQVTAKVTNESCKGNDGVVILSATGGTKPYSYTLNGITNSTGLFTALDSGTYKYTVTDGAGCKTVGTATIKATASLKVGINVSGYAYGLWGTYILFLTDHDPNPKVKLTAYAKGGAGSYWYDWGKAGKTATITVSPKRNTYYTVVVTDQAGCKAQCKVIILVIDLRWPGKGGARIITTPSQANEQILSSDEVIELEQQSLHVKDDIAAKSNLNVFRLYPNPASGYINVETGKKSINTSSEVEISNMQGQIVVRKKITGSLNRIETGTLSQGSYILTVKSSGIITNTGKFTIIR